MVTIANKIVISILILILLVPTIALATSCPNPITSCGCDLESGVTYTLANDISTTSGTCLEFTPSDIVLDCKGFTISGSGATGSIGINLKNVIHVIKYCNIINFDYGINYDTGSISGTVIRDNNISGNTRGIRIVKNGECTNMQIYRNRIFNNNVRGLYMTACSGNKIYDNFFNNNINVEDDDSNSWNIEKTLGTNIIGGSYIGGNYYTNSDGNGYSDTCADTDKDGLCDIPYDIYGGGSSKDNLPLAAKTCGLSVNDIDFISVETGQISAEQNVTLNNTGNSNTASLTIKGFDWTPFMSVGQTHWNTTTSGMDYLAMNTLTTSEVSLGLQVSPGVPLPVYFRLKIPEGQTQGSYTQTITFTGGC